MKYAILKKTRVVIALLFFTFTLFSFIDLYEVLPEHITSKILYLQFVPSLLKFIQITSIFSIGFIVIIIITVLLGRVYCSTICPLGILQDIFSWVSKKISARKFYFRWKKEQPKTRYTILVFTTLSLILGTSLLINLLDPYSNSGRIFTYNIKPLAVWLNNILASNLHQQEIYSANIIETSNTPWLITAYSIAFLLLIAFLSYKRGRLFCNLICPVGSLLGIISKKSIFKFYIDSKSCTKCNKCVGICKSECINIKTQTIDHSRCVSCYNCLNVCQDSAIHYAIPDNTLTSNKGLENINGINRRKAIATLLTITASSTILAQSDTIFNTGTNSNYKLSIRKNPISPPGSENISRFNSICTACGLCISTCPTNVLQPAVKEYGIIGFMQPHMDYANSGFCNFDCNRCSEICPTGAILPLDIKKKQLTQIGKAVFVQQNCVVYREQTDCGACSEHCPTKAVQMVTYKNGLVIPEVNQDICIGCGACEHPCPVEYPHKAIYIEGNPQHIMASKPEETESLHKPLKDDFPF